MKVSVCLIVKNEQENLPRALGSIPEGYEIVVTDTGSTDETVNIAKRYGAKIHYFEWQEDFSAARNACASQATGDYILAMDADEELPPDADRQIREFIGKFPNQAGCIYIHNSMEGSIKRHRMVRFYPRQSGFYFHGPVHEQIYRDGAPASFEILPIQMAHYGYEDTEYERKNKSARYLPYYEKYLKQYPNDGYMLYQLGKLYSAMEEWETAERYLLASKEQEQFNRLYYPVMLVLLGYTWKEQGRSAEAERLLQPFAPMYSDFPDLFFLLGLLAMDTGNISAVETRLTEALRIGDTDKYTSVYGTGSFLAAYNLGVYYEVTGQTDLAVQCYRFAAEYEYEPALARLK